MSLNSVDRLAMFVSCRKSLLVNDDISWDLADFKVSKRGILLFATWLGSSVPGHGQFVFYLLVSEI